MALPPPPAGFVRMTLAATGGEQYAPIDTYRNIWWAKGWRSIDDPAFIGTPEDDPDRYVTVAHGWGTHWQEARNEAGSRQVKVHLWGDSIFQGVGATNPREQGCAELIGDALRATYGDGGTGWLPAALSSSNYILDTTGTPTGGTFTLNVSVNGGGTQTTATIAHTASAATVATAIENLANVPTGAVKTNGGALPTAIGIVFVGDLADDTVVVTIGTNSLTGGTSPAPRLQGWTAGMGMGGCQLRTTTHAALHFADMRGTNIRIFHRNTATASFRYRIDGGSWTTHNIPAAFGQDPGAATVTGLSNTAHTVDIEWLSGTVDIFGVEALRPTGVVVYRFAQSGRAASDYFYGRHRKVPGGTSPNRGFNGTNGAATVTVPAPGVFTSDMQGQYITGPAGIAANATILTVDSATQVTMSANHTATFSNAEGVISDKGNAGILGVNMCADPFLAEAIGRPDLVIVQLGANDPAGANNDSVTTRDGLSKILRLYTQGDAIDHSPDSVLVVEHIGNWFDIESEFASVAGSIAQAATGNGAALVDIWGLGQRSWKYWSDLGMFADTIHPSTAGHAAYATPVIDLLRS